MQESLPKGSPSGWRGVGLEKGEYPRDRDGQGICALGHDNTKALRWEKASWCHPGVKFTEIVRMVEIRRREAGTG